MASGGRQLQNQQCEDRGGAQQVITTDRLRELALALGAIGSGPEPDGAGDGVQCGQKHRGGHETE